MKLCAFIVVLVALCGFVLVAIFAFIWLDELTCDNNGKIMRKGEMHLPLGMCMAVECRAYGSLRYKSCYTIEQGGNCTFTHMDFSKTYPECCGKLTCQ